MSRKERCSSSGPAAAAAAAAIDDEDGEDCLNMNCRCPDAQLARGIIQPAKTADLSGGLFLYNVRRSAGSRVCRK